MTDLELVCECDGLKFSELQFGAGFPVEWAFSNDDGMGGTPPADAGTIYFTVSRAGEELYEDGVTVSCTLQQLVEFMHEGTKGHDDLIGGEHLPDAQRLITALRSAADWLDERLLKVPAQ